ncbi:Frizzled/Smoothened family membrane region containing protein [Aphelenchoides besseyi]|nr:Frizzled/Smoothened family membrane region containing protein [Aphelenchoides besseyi]KAI6199594.1 Frizzled/Smoothened family membrane region containing protein [Aphelenchoides besseyi]
MRAFLILLVSAQLVMQLVVATKKCEPITIPLCKNIGYNTTAYPNSLGHETQEEAGLEVHQFYALVEVGCYVHLRFMLCGIYSPICQNDYDLDILPCQEVCNEAQRKCSPLMEQHGFKWPDTLNCDRLPRFKDQQSTGTLCAAPPDATRSDKSKAIDEDSSFKVDEEHNRVNVDRSRGHKRPPAVRPTSTADRCDCQCTTPFRLISTESGNSNLFQVQNVSNCAYSCDGLLNNPTQIDRDFVRKWTLIFTAICFGLSFFTVLTFSIDLNRFPYPERPILYFALCQSLFAVGYLVPALYDGEPLGCESGLLRQANSPIAKSGSFGCTIVFGLVYYFSMAGAAFWVVLTVSFLLAAVPHWSCEWIAHWSPRFHVLAWGIPAIQTALVYYFGAVDGDPLTGVCSVGNTNTEWLLIFVIAPLAFYLVVGLLCLFTGFRNLCGIRANLKKTHPSIDKTSKLTQLMSKIGLFAAIYSVSILLQLALLSFEYVNRPKWERALLCPLCLIDQLPTNDTLYYMSLMKTVAVMITGWSSAVWILSPKTIQSWKQRLCCQTSQYATLPVPFGDHLVGPYQQIPQLPKNPPPHNQMNKAMYPSPILDVYNSHEIVGSPFLCTTMRHNGYYPDNV